jgi:hypothetical protein
MAARGMKVLRHVILNDQKSATYKLELRPIADREVRSAVARFSAMWYNRLASKSTKRHRT